MGEGEPLRQQPGGLIRGGPVKRHHRRRDARRPQQLGAPPITDGHDLDQVCAPTNGFFVAMNGHNVMFERSGERRLIIRVARWRSSEAPREGGVHTTGCVKLPRIALKKHLRWLFVHSFCTRHPQLFHTTDLKRRSTGRTARLQ